MLERVLVASCCALLVPTFAHAACAPAESGLGCISVTPPTIHGGSVGGYSGAAGAAIDVLSDAIAGAIRNADPVRQSINIQLDVDAHWSCDQKQYLLGRLDEKMQIDRAGGSGGNSNLAGAVWADLGC
jgi:hypothetical protein